MDRFSKYNPKATLLYFACILTATMIIFNPIYLAVSLACALCYKLILSGKRALSYLLRLAFPVILLTALFNMLFVHKGITILFAVGDTIFTAEALFYGFSQGLMFSAVMLWLSCYNDVVSAEGLVSVFGKLSPNTALVFMMTLTFIPRLKKNISEINDARLLLTGKESRIKKALGNLSALISMTLEESIETANSMKARDFSNKRTVYSKYRFSSADAVIIISELLLLAACVAVKLSGLTLFVYEPIIVMNGISITGITAFSLLALLPIVTDIVENIKWQLLKRKI